jgi:hypothetical protein
MMGFFVNARCSSLVLILTLLGSTSGCWSDRKNDPNDLMEVVNNDVVQLARKSTSVCKGPVKMVLVSRREDGRLKLSYRCTTVERSGVKPEDLDSEIQELSELVNKMDTQQKKKLYRIEHEEISPTTDGQ